MADPVPPGEGRERAARRAEKPPKPTRLEFRMEDGQFRGFDPDNRADYRIGWCGNGSMSHWILTLVDTPGMVWYVFIIDKAELRRSIYEAEYRLVYGAEPPPEARP